MTESTNIDEELLAGEAVSALRRISRSRGLAANRRDAVDAAIRVDRLLKLLRGTDSGRALILALLEDASPNAVTADELRYAAGIQEFARRIRELREQGFDIRPTGDGYRLEQSTS
jgi:biotin operon repressor